MKDLYIVGAGGFGREVAWLVRRINEQKRTWHIVGFLDDDPKKINTFEDGYPVVAGIDFLKTVTDETYVICAIGASLVRKKIVDKINSYNNSHIKYPVLIDPSVIAASSDLYSEGDIICAGSIITVNAQIGKHVIVNLDCTIGHEAILADYDTLYPSVNISGAVKVGANVEIGTGSQVIQGITIADEVIIGAGGTVIKDIVDKGTYVGCPVRKVK